MIYSSIIYKEHDYEAIKILGCFLPDKIFDAHAHLHDTRFLPAVHPVGDDACFGESTGFGGCHTIGNMDAYEKAIRPMLSNPKVLKLHAITYPDKSMSNINGKEIKMSDDFLILAHAARSFAAWTAIEYIKKIYI